MPISFVKKTFLILLYYVENLFSIYYKGTSLSDIIYLLMYVYICACRVGNTEKGGSSCNGKIKVIHREYNDLRSGRRINSALGFRPITQRKNI